MKATHNFYYSPTQKERTRKMYALFPEFSLNGDGVMHTLMINGVEYTECREIGKGALNYADAQFVGQGTYSDIKIIK